MTSSGPKDIAASVRQRLLNQSKVCKDDFNLILTNYAIERILARLSRSGYSDQFVLKGAQLFKVWMESPHRATRDLDMLGIGVSEIPVIEVIFRDICAFEMPYPDGIVFDEQTVKGEPIREDGVYQGIRLTVSYSLSGARDNLQIDIGFGDVVTPAAPRLNIPSMLDFPPVNMLVYPKESVIAEKLEAMVVLGMRNSRMKDFYDIRELSKRFSFRGAELCQAIAATFHRRQTPIPHDAPFALTSEFASDASKRQQWAGFLRRQKLNPSPCQLENVIEDIRKFLLPVIEAARSGNDWDAVWEPESGWRI
jgi:predicted nucleotidyltransferase component of viral defense system